MSGSGSNSTIHHRPIGGAMGPTVAILPPLPEDAVAASSASSRTFLMHTSTDNENFAASSSMTSSTSSTSPNHTRHPLLSTNSQNNIVNAADASPRLSSPWDSDLSSNHCSSCYKQFDAFFQRKHHCRLCGKLFCHECSNTRSLIPPSAIVLKGTGNGDHNHRGGGPSFFSPSSSEHQGDANISYVGSSSSSYASTQQQQQQQQCYDDTLLYGRGLEQRILMARHPQRTCHPCHAQLQPLQEELCLRNSNAMRYNYIDEGDALRRICNSPLAFTLGHEVRKAAYALGNLLPGEMGSGIIGSRSTATTAGSRRGGGGGGKRGGFVPTSSSSSNYSGNFGSSAWEGDDYYNSNNEDDDDDKCHIPNAVATSCKTFDPSLRNLDGGMLHIPSKLLIRARGVAIVTCCKGGLGFAGFEFGTGLVVARRQRPVGGDEGDSGIEGGGVSSLDDWSAPSAIGIAGFAWGALLGAQVSDHVFLLMTDDAVRLFASEKGGKSIQLGADVGVAVGPVGRSAEADFGAGSGGGGQHHGLAGGRGGGFVMAPIFTYSLSRGLYAGVSLDGRILMTRDRVNEKFYGRSVSPSELLSGQVPIPPAAQPLYDALKRCRIYGSGGGGGGGGGGERRQHDRHEDVVRGGGGNRIMDGHYGDGIVSTSSSGGGGFMERWSHTTGAGLPVSPSTWNNNNTSNNSSNNPYNLSGRTDDYPAYY